MSQPACLCTPLLAALVCFLLPIARLQADDVKPPAAKKTQFVRLAREGKSKEPVALETSVVRYRSSTLTVDLIAAVHIGDRSYYRKLNRLFEDYDVLLYELVAPKGTRVPRGGRSSDNPVALLQKLATIVLGLDSQTECIDYTCKNFVHADMSPDEMAEVMRKRGDDGLTIALGVAADMLRQVNLQQQKQPAGNGADVPDIFALLADEQGPLKMKRMLAEQLARMDDPDASLGQTLTRILVADRNQACLRVLQQEIARGRKKIGIFYGAAHMPDFDARLRVDFDLRPASTQWLTAWDLDRDGPNVEGLLFKLLRDQ